MDRHHGGEEAGIDIEAPHLLRTEEGVSPAGARTANRSPMEADWQVRTKGTFSKATQSAC